MDEIKNLNWGNLSPLPHQLEGVELLEKHKKFMLYWHMGVGKTITTVVTMIQVIKEKGPWLVVCPKGVMPAWIKELSENSPSTRFQVIVGTAAKREKLIAMDADVFIVNYDILWADQDALMQKKFIGMVLDESHNVKNFKADMPKAKNSRRGVAAWRISRGIEYRFLLSGTPIGNNPEDIYGQFKIMDDGVIFGQNYYGFMARYFTSKNNTLRDGRSFKTYTLNKEMLPEFKRKMAEGSHRVKKNAVTDLPPQIFQQVHVELDAKQKKLYLELEQEIKTEYSDRITASFLAKHTKLNQVCAGFVYSEIDDIKKTVEFNQTKIKALYQLWEDAAKPKLVIWCLFTYDIDRIMKHFKKAGHKISKIDGSVSAMERKDTVERFQTGDTEVIVLQEKAGAEGITLTASSFVIIYTRSNVLITRRQLLDRVHRMGQKCTVNYYDLVVPGTVETDILEVFEEMIKTSDYLAGDIPDDEYFSPSEINNMLANKIINR